MKFHTVLLSGISIPFFGWILFGCRGDSEDWALRTQKESIRVLSRITSTNELARAEGNGGVSLFLTNGSWIIIRVVVEFEPDREVTVARDSDGRWFESKFKFTGGLTWYPQYKMPVKPGEIKTTTPECPILERAEGAPNLAEAWKVLESLKFVPLRR